MDHFVTLNRLPEGVQFPPELSDRIRYDGSSCRLVFQGFMSKAEFDRLSVLSPDWPYRRALEDLFRLCTPQDESGPGPLQKIRAFLTGWATPKT
jgi:hypothetical protein